MKDDEITLNGFLVLNLMEAQDAEGDPNDLWVTLESMGYNNALELDQVLITSNTQPYPYTKPCIHISSLIAIKLSPAR